MYLRDMRSLAADLAGDIGEATKLLQHTAASALQNDITSNKGGEIEMSEQCVDCRFFKFTGRPLGKLYRRS